MRRRQLKYNIKEAIEPTYFDCSNSDIISDEECRSFLIKYDFSDQRISEIKDSLIGIVDSIFNSYLEEFK